MLRPCPGAPSQPRRLLHALPLGLLLLSAGCIPEPTFNLPDFTPAPSPKDAAIPADLGAPPDAAATPDAATSDMNRATDMPPADLGPVPDLAKLQPAPPTTLAHSQRWSLE